MEPIARRPSGFQGIPSPLGAGRPAFQQGRNIIISQPNAEMRQLRKDVQAELDAYQPPYLTNTDYKARLDPFKKMREPLFVYSWLHAVLFSRIGIERLKAMKVLEIGPNYGGYMHYLKNVHGIDITGIDVSTIDVALARSAGLNVFEADARKMPFADGTFDLVFSHVLVDSYLQASPEVLSVYAPTLTMPEADRNYNLAITREVARVLKAGGFYYSQADQNESSSLQESFTSLEEMIINNDDGASEFPIRIAQK